MIMIFFLYGLNRAKAIAIVVNQQRLIPSFHLIGIYRPNTPGASDNMAPSSCQTPD